MNSIATEIRYLYYYYLGKLDHRNKIRDQEVLDLIKELVNEGHWMDSSIPAVIERLKNKEEKSNEVG